MLPILIYHRTQSPQENSTPLEVAEMGSPQTCHFPSISPKHPRSSSPCDTDPHVPLVYKEKGASVFCGRAPGCCQQRRTTALSRSGAVGSGHCCKDAVLQSVNMPKEKTVEVEGIEP